MINYPKVEPGAGAVPATGGHFAARTRQFSFVLLVFAVFGLYLFTSGSRHFHYDSGVYWGLGHRFYSEGRFSLLAYDDALRGYFYPLINLLSLGLRKALGWEAVTVVKLLNAGLAAFGFGWLGPALWQAATGAPALASVRRRAVFAGLGFVFWRGYFNFPLSDFPAVLALGGAWWLACRGSRWPGALVAGACLAIALNMRPIYLASAPFFFGVLLVVPGAARRWGLVLAALLGAGLVLLPQFLINQRHFQVSTPLVLARSQTQGIDKLYLQKLKWGIVHQKYETSMGSSYPRGPMFFFDPAGQKILRAERITWFDTPADYVALVARHPADFVAMYLRRLFNGLDVQYVTPYVGEVYASSLGLALTNYTMLFAALLYLLFAPRPPLRAYQWLVLGGWLMPCAAVLPMSMECRFLLPLHLLLYALVAFGWPAQWRPGFVSAGTKWLLIISYLGFVGLCFGLSAAAQAHLEKGPRLLTIVVSH